MNNIHCTISKPDDDIYFSAAALHRDHRTRLSKGLYEPKMVFIITKKTATS